jgi:hypothetical protein
MGKFHCDLCCERLLYFEGYEDIRTAIAKENNAKAGGAQ